MPTARNRVETTADRGIMGFVTEAQALERISVDPEVCGGKPCIRGHRIWVGLILGFLAQGMTTGEILEEYPQLEEADIRACIAYGGLLANGRFVELT